MSFSQGGVPGGYRDDYYEILDVSPSASVREVKAGYRKLMRRLHPDMGDGGVLDNEFSYLIALVTEAKDVLTDPVRRAAYDERVGLEVERIQEEVVEAREAEGYATLVENVEVAPPVEVKVAWWRQSGIVRLARLVGMVVGVLLTVVSGVVLYMQGWGWVFMLIPFLALWWGYLRHGTRFNAGVWVVGMVLLGWVGLRGSGVGLAPGIMSLAWVWLGWAAVMGVVLFAHHVLVIPFKRVWDYGLVVPSAHAVATGSLLEKVGVLPGAIVVHGLSVSVDGREVACDHAVMCGRKVAFVNSVEVNAGSVRWDASGRGVVNNERDVIDTDAALVGSVLKDKQLLRVAEVEEFVFCHARNGRVEISSSSGLPVLVNAESGVDALVRWLMQDNDCAVSRKRVVESVWRNVR